jgi:beta-galactosidase
VKKPLIWQFTAKEDADMKKLWILSIVVAAALALAQGGMPRAGLTSEVRMLNGLPALYVNGTLTSQILAAPYRPGPSDFNDFRKAGISSFNIYLRFDWTAPDKYDFAKIDDKLDAYLKIDPKSLFLPRILLTPGPWWCKEFPDEITMRDDGTPAGMFGQPCHPSLASEKYRELSHKAMIAFLNHVEGKYGDHILGYQVGNGFGGEWLTFNSFWETRPGAQPPTKFGVEDYSPPAQALFRTWLKKKYGTVQALRRAWNDPQVAFETATPPNEVERYSSNHGVFFDPGVSRRVPDYFTFFNEMVADVLIENARWVKENTGHRKIVGAFYGYLWCNFPNLSAVHSGHLAFAKVLRSPDVDFIASCYTYDNKQLGGPNNSQSLPDAAALHGKLYFNEVDTETHLLQRQWRWGDSLRNPTNFEETKGLLVRDYAYALTKGFGMWWTDLHGGTYHDDNIISLFGRMRQIDEAALNVDRRADTDIAVIVDEASFTYTGDGEPLWNALMTAQKQWEFAFIGAPWDGYLLTDIGNPRLRDYKFYIFLNTFQVTPEQRTAIHARLKRNGATALWIYAPGYIGEKLSPDGMKSLTGIQLAENITAGELRVEVTAFDHPYTKSLPRGLVYGTDVNVENIKRWYDHQIYLKDPRDPSLRRDLPGFRVSPRFFSSDPQAKTLGTLAGLDKPGLVVKRQSGWTSVYSSAPLVPASLLRTIALAAGCHIYSDAGDVVYASRNFIGVYAPRGGSRTFRLPRRSRVIDLLEDRVLADGVTDLPLKLAANQSVLLKLEDSQKK